MNQRAALEEKEHLDRSGSNNENGADLGATVGYGTIRLSKMSSGGIFETHSSIASSLTSSSPCESFSQSSTSSCNELELGYGRIR